MYYKNTEIHYSPSDLITFLESPFASHMERSLLEDKSVSKYLILKTNAFKFATKGKRTRAKIYFRVYFRRKKKVLKIQDEN